MRIFAYTSILVFWISCLNAQKPKWIDPDWRMANYPEAEYITSFISQVNYTNENTTNLLDRLEEQSRSNLIRQIQVQVESASDLSIGVIDGKTTEEFQLQSESLSRADIAGMRTERYHDRRRKEVFVFSWVNRANLIDYYTTTIESSFGRISSKINEGENYKQKRENIEAMKSFNEAMNMFAQLEEAQFILIALGKNNDSELRITEGDLLKQSVRASFTNIKNHAKANIEELAWFIAFGLHLQLGENQQPIHLEPVTYDGSALGSEFANRLHEALKRNLVANGNYRLLSNVNDQLAGTYLQAAGTYWQEDEYIKTNVVVKQNGIALAAEVVRLPKKWLTENKINYIPQQFSRINILKSIKIKALQEQVNLKAGRSISQPLQVMLTAENNKALANAPVQFIVENTNEKLCQTITDGSGIASCFPGLSFHSPQVLKIKVVLDVSSFVDIEPGSPFLNRVERDFPVAAAEIVINVQPLTVFITSNERDHFNRLLEIKMIEPSVKDALVAKKFVFTDQHSNADFSLFIDAKARHGSNTQGLYFSFVDLNISITDLADGREFWKSGQSSIKGAGADYRSATVKAFEEAARIVLKALPESFETNF